MDPPTVNNGGVRRGGSVAMAVAAEVKAPSAPPKASMGCQRHQWHCRRNQWRHQRR